MMMTAVSSKKPHGGSLLCSAAVALLLLTLIVSRDFFMLEERAAHSRGSHDISLHIRAEALLGVSSLTSSVAHEEEQENDLALLTGDDTNAWDDDDGTTDDDEVQDDDEIAYVIATSTGTVAERAGYRSIDEMDGRAKRFPSIRERVQLYMSNWYLPPCPEDHDGFVQYSFVAAGVGNRAGGEALAPADSEARLELLAIREIPTTAFYGGRTFWLSPSTELTQLHYLQDRSQIEKCPTEYCIDTERYWFATLDRIQTNNETFPPMLFQFSDEAQSKAYHAAAGRYALYPAVPHLKKSRLALSAETVSSTEECIAGPRDIPLTVSGQTDYLQPIIYKFKMNRHYGMMSRMPERDTPWHEKKNTALFRGTLTGFFPVQRNGEASLVATAPNRKNAGATDDLTRCLLLDRCRLVYNTANSSLVDAKLVPPIKPNQPKYIHMPRTVNGVKLFAERMSKKDMLQHKAIIMLEGNDAGTGFKWALFSNSVVLTTQPKFTSWAMEELLEPWVHYVPLKDDFLDVQEKMQWVIDHDEEAAQIARRGALWIRDLIQHPDAASDDEQISDEMAQRYAAHFALAADSESLADTSDW